MANFVSPGVYVVERDDSAYTPAINPTVVGIVGFADKGPTNKATLITNQQSLVDTFGQPREDLAGQGLEGALEILETCNQMYYVRAVDDTTAKNASAMNPIGACPTMAVSAGRFGVGSEAGAGSSLWLKIDVTNNAGVKQYTTTRSFAITSSLTVGGAAVATQAAAMRSVLGGSLDSDDIGSFHVSSDATLTLANPVGRDFVGVCGIPSIGNFLVGAYAGSGASLSVSAFSDAAMTKGAGVLVAVDSSGFTSGVAALGGRQQRNFGCSGFSSMQVYGWTFETGARSGATPASGLGYLTESIYPGLGYAASTTPDGTLLGNSITVEAVGGRNFDLRVNNNGVAAETFKASLVASGAFIEDVINTGTVDLTSQYIKGNLLLDGSAFNNTKLSYWQQHVSGLNLPGNQVKGTGGKIIAGKFWGEDGAASRGVHNEDHVNGALIPRFAKFVGGTTNLVGGANGDGNGNTDLEAAALIGKTSPSRTGMQVFNNELVPITLGLVPGISDQAVQNALITLAETTGDFLSVFGTPIGIGNPGDAINYANGQSTARTSAFNSSYAALYYPAVKVFQSYLSKDIWMDPAIFAVRQMGFTDTVADLWFAPAGFSRGRLTKPTDTEVDINQGDRDALYSGGNIINPIVNFAGQGITIFGQRTTQRASTALDRINVRRLMVYLKRVITAATLNFVFEPNDKMTQETIQNVVSPMLGDIQRRRGITEFKVICDETVNTPVRVDRNELWCKVFIKPTKAAEVLIFELNITNQSANLG